MVELFILMMLFVFFFGAAVLMYGLINLYIAIEKRRKKVRRNACKNA